MELYLPGNPTDFAVIVYYYYVVVHVIGTYRAVNPRAAPLDCFADSGLFRVARFACGKSCGCQPTPVGVGCVGLIDSIRLDLGSNLLD